MIKQALRQALDTSGTTPFSARKWLRPPILRQSPCHSITVGRLPPSTRVSAAVLARSGPWTAVSTHTRRPASTRCRIVRMASLSPPGTHQCTTSTDWPWARALPLNITAPDPASKARRGSMPCTSVFIVTSSAGLLGPIRSHLPSAPQSDAPRSRTSESSVVCSGRYSSPASSRDHSPATSGGQTRKPAQGGMVSVLANQILSKA